MAIKSNVAPWPIVSQHWDATYDVRQLLFHDISISVNDYIILFPCLQTQKSKELVSLIFTVHKENFVINYTVYYMKFNIISFIWF